MALLALHMVQFFAWSILKIEHGTIAGFWEILIRDAADALPGGRTAVWILSGILVFIAYRIAERQFERAESLPGDDRHIDMTPLLTRMGRTAERWP
jgi:hypothetical protein